MRAHLAELARRTAAGSTVAVSTVVRTRGSSPREVGASMLLTEEGSILGSLSGGCLEADVLEDAEQVLIDGALRGKQYGPADADDPFVVGLTCGGLVDVVTRGFGPAHSTLLCVLAVAVDRGRDAALVTLLDPGSNEPQPVLVFDEGEIFGSLGDGGLDATVSHQLPALVRDGWSGVLRLGRTGRRDETGVGVFVESFTAPPRMLIVGATDAAAALAQVSKGLGYHVTVSDPRRRFTTDDRFPFADEVVAEWPHRLIEQFPLDSRSAVCVLTHDPRIDVPVLTRALRGRAGYVGAMGSLRTHFDRLDRLRAAGATEAEIDRLDSPIGLDIGATTPMQIAISIASGIIAAGSSRSGAPMRDRTVGAESP